MNVAINALRARSGGAQVHLIGLISNINPKEYGISQIHIWSYPELLVMLPSHDWLIKHSPSSCSKSIVFQLFWERFSLIKQVKYESCKILFNVDAGTVCRFQPNVTMSRDMLSYEPGEMKRYGFSLARVRLLVLLWVQNVSLRQAAGVIFLTQYASNVIQKISGPFRNVAIIPHGISESFHQIKRSQLWPVSGERLIDCLYVSNTAPYKHQWNVVIAIAMLRELGYDIRLTLVGGGSGKAQARLSSQISLSDSNRQFVRQFPFVPHQNLPGYLSKADIFIFASSCENMPNTLIEAMAAGLPIACSDRGPMPEVLSDAGVYFNPEIPNSIASAIEKLLINDQFRVNLATKAKELAKEYSWKRTAFETFNFIHMTIAQK